MIIPINLGEHSYDIIVERGALLKADKYLDLNRKVLIVTDEGVPAEYAKTIYCNNYTLLKHLLSFHLEKIFQKHKTACNTQKAGR